MTVKVHNYLNRTCKIYINGEKYLGASEFLGLP